MRDGVLHSIEDQQSWWCWNRCRCRTQTSRASGGSNWLVLDDPGDDREKGNIDTDHVNMADIGDVQKLQLRCRQESATPDAPDWHLDRICVCAGEIPAAVKILLDLPIGNIQYKRRKFADAFRAAPRDQAIQLRQVDPSRQVRQSRESPRVDRD